MPRPFHALSQADPTTLAPAALKEAIGFAKRRKKLEDRLRKVKQGEGTVRRPSPLLPSPSSTDVPWSHLPARFHFRHDHLLEPNHRRRRTTSTHQTAQRARPGSAQVHDPDLANQPDSQPLPRTTSPCAFHFLSCRFNFHRILLLPPGIPRNPHLSTAARRRWYLPTLSSPPRRFNSWQTSISSDPWPTAHLTGPRLPPPSRSTSLLPQLARRTSESCSTTRLATHRNGWSSTFCTPSAVIYQRGSFVLGDSRTSDRIFRRCSKAGHQRPCPPSSVGPDRLPSRPAGSRHPLGRHDDSFNPRACNRRAGGRRERAVHGCSCDVGGGEDQDAERRA